MTATTTSLVNVRLTLAYLAEQPIIHTEDTIGNISKLKKMRVLYNGKPESVPALSGNSFRGQLRDILADQLCSCLSNNGEKRLTFTNNDTYGILYSGGALGDKSTGADLLSGFQQWLPSIRLMGAAFGNIMLPSKIAATHIVPCAKETQHIVQTMYEALGSDTILPAPDAWPKARDLLFNDGPLTRKDDSRDLTRQRFANPKPESQSNTTDMFETETTTNDQETQKGPQMIYYVECIPPGTWLVQQLYSKLPLDQQELGCLFDGLTAFLEQPAIGGRSAAGYGQVRVSIRGTVGEEELAWPDAWPQGIITAMDVYKTYLTDKQQEILTALTVKA